MNLISPFFFPFLSSPGLGPSPPRRSSLWFWIPPCACLCVRASSFWGHGAIRVRRSCLVVGEELRAALPFLLLEKSGQSWCERFVAAWASRFLGGDYWFATDFSFIVWFSVFTWFGCLLVSFCLRNGNAKLVVPLFCSVVDYCPAGALKIQKQSSRAVFLQLLASCAGSHPAATAMWERRRS